MIVVLVKVFEVLGEIDKVFDVYWSIFQYDENKLFFFMWVLLDVLFLIVRKGKVFDFLFVFEVL